VNKIIQKQRLIRHGNIPISKNFNTDTMLYADDQILLTKSEDHLQYSVHNLNNTAEEFSMEVNTAKTKIKAFTGKEPMRSKICVSNRILEQVKILNYL
jgi:hypothetical protein